MTPLLTLGLLDCKVVSRGLSYQSPFFLFCLNQVPPFFKLLSLSFLTCGRSTGHKESDTSEAEFSTPTYRHTDTYSMRVCCAQALP